MAASASLNQKEIRKLFKEARRVLKHPCLDILIAPSSSEQGRLLVVTPGRIGTAPERNKIRRRLKALFYEENRHEHPYDLVLFIKKEALALSYDELKALVLPYWGSIT